MLEHRPDFLQIEAVDVRQEDDAVRVADRQARDAVVAAADDDGFVDDALAGQIHRDERGRELGPSHVGRDGRDLAADGVHVHFAQLAAHLDRHVALGHDAGVKQVIAHAAQGVSADAAVRAVHVVNLHRRIGRLRREKRHDAVAADAEVPVAQADGEALGAVDQARVQAVEVNIVVAACLHLGKRQAPLCFPHVVDVDKLDRRLGVPAHQAVDDGVGRINGRQARDGALDGLAPDLHRGARRDAPLRGGRYDVVDDAALDEREAVGVAFVDFADGDSVDAAGLDGHRRAGRCVDREPEVGEFAHDVEDLRLVAVAHGDEYAARFIELVPRGAQPLYSASSRVVAMPSTSPVDFISGPSIVSTFKSFSNEKTGTLTATYGDFL